MISTTGLITLSLCAAAIILLLMRRFLRRRHGQASNDQRRSVDPKTTAGSKKPDPDSSQVLAPESSPDNVVDAVPSIAARSSVDVSWKNRKLFTDYRGAYSEDGANDLPHIEPHEVPTVDTSSRVFGSLTPLLANLLPEKESRRQKTKRQLQTAGYYQPHAAHNLAAIRYVSMIAPLIILGPLLIVIPPQLESWVMGALILFPLLGWSIPQIYVQLKAADRTSEIERAMPDMLDMLNMCVSQGLTVPESLRRVGRDLCLVYPALAHELSIVSQQADVGTLKVALENFSKRVDVSEVHSFTSVINQTARMGTSVSDALTEYSDSMRESLRQRADEKANQASFKLLFPTVLCLMPAVYIFLLGPAIIELSGFFSEGGREVLNQSTQAIRQATQ